MSPKSHTSLNLKRPAQGCVLIQKEMLPHHIVPLPILQDYVL
jgi:hypothetical protein